VTDAGVGELAALKSLTFIDLTATGVPRAGVAVMKGSLPQCSIRQ